MAYDPNNIFAKILKGDIPCQKIYQDKYALAFYDVNPQAALHALIIPTGPYISGDDFHEKASDAELVGYYRALNKVLEVLNLKENDGYRLLSNSGKNAGQEVPHFHTHIFGKQRLGPMLSTVKK
ncbi:MAG: HIT domain-containing protein [Alphaproteobacteria bacterium]|nr:HIT domain-containing protein [Alphaproteobacteria bacterium]NCP61648.1 HIT domain-containing protein [Alphaproteobacteria bacterium]NCQ67349.1 HIT domain-containing protein [Alphaproteobacteria bacterium]NCT06684.1 HIT domain-containing protein [Alphaproteobacteria bacterium]